MERWWQATGVLGVALLFGWDVTSAVEVSDAGADERQTFDFDIPALPLASAAEAFARRTGRRTYIGHEAFEACGNYLLEPLIGRFTAPEAWRRLTAPICAGSGVARGRDGEPPLYLVDHPRIAERAIRIPRAALLEALDSLSQQFGDLPLEYRAIDLEEGQRLVGPIAGHIDAETALEQIEAQIGAGLRHRRDGPFLLLESGAGTQPYERRYIFGRECACPLRIEAPPSRTVTVIEPAVSERDRAGVVTYTREQIESTGASTLPQFFRYLAQNGYTRPEGYIASGAQYADFRGLGRDTHLVTVNGRRTLPSANNVSSSAFDLNTIPLPAVDHVDVRVDAGSMRVGSDAIAGAIDIVTRRDLKSELQLRYGVADGGAEERRTTVSVGHRSPGGRVAAVFDYFETGELLGDERALSRDQNYSRLGGLDYRSVFGIRSLDGMALPGLQASIAGLPDTRAAEVLSIAELLPGEPQRVSLSSYQSIVPATRRRSLVASADTVWRGVAFAADLLWVDREAVYQYFPATASGVVSEAHPGNPFDERIWIDALLTGASPMQQHVDSTLQRAVLSARGDLGRWTWELAMLDSDERAAAWFVHSLDLARTADALLPTTEDSVLDVFALRPGGAEAPTEIWAEPVKQRFSSAGTHWLGSLQVPLRSAHLRLGFERREEAMQFSAAVGRVERNVWGGYAQLALPLVSPHRQMVGVKRLTAYAGLRRDAFSDVAPITRRHFELEWQLNDHLSVDANLAQQYRPPSLFELNLPQIAMPVQLYDPKRQEVASAILFAGGNPHLRPTTGKSTHLRARYESANGLTASINFFSIRLWDRIAALPISAVLAAEDQMPDRVKREPTAEETEAGLPGRLISVDVMRNNVGRLFTRGLDVSVEKRFDAAAVSWTPRMDLTWIDTFRYSDVPGSSAPMTDRVGLASEQGTITPWRAVVSLRWQGRSWAGTTFLRMIPEYDDVDGRSISRQYLLDLNVSYAPTPALTLTLGAMDLANTSPHFARIGAATGYDSSQWDPVGRRFMLTAKVSL